MPDAYFLQYYSISEVVARYLTLKCSSRVHSLHQKIACNPQIKESLLAGHAIYSLDAVKHVIKVSTKTLLEEPRAELTALHTLLILLRTQFADEVRIRPSTNSIFLYSGRDTNVTHRSLEARCCSVYLFWQLKIIPDRYNFLSFHPSSCRWY